jgi:membrane-associated PAP2 superfamily phosphatase
MIRINELPLSKDTKIIINVKKKVSLLLTLIILSSWCFCVYPQNPSTNFYKSDSIFSFHSQKGFVPALFTDFGEQISAPFKFKTKQWLLTGAAIGITAALIHVDNEIDDWAKVQKQKHNWVNKTSPFITEFGGNYGILSVVAFGSLSAVFKNEKGVQTSLLASQAMITSGVWVHIIKQFTGRERPEADYINSKSEGGKWYGPFVQYDQDLAVKKPGSSFDSFPSGHAATAFSIATVFASQYKDTRFIPVISYSLASLVGISRLTEHEHWASDVFAGAILGYVCGKQVVANFNKTHQNDISQLDSNLKDKVELTFFQYENQVGISMKW